MKANPLVLSSYDPMQIYLETHAIELYGTLLSENMHNTKLEERDNGFLSIFLPLSDSEGYHGPLHDSFHIIWTRKV